MSVQAPRTLSTMREVSWMCGARRGASRRTSPPLASERGSMTAWLSRLIVDHAGTSAGARALSVMHLDGRCGRPARPLGQLRPVAAHEHEVGDCSPGRTAPRSFRPTARAGLSVSARIAAGRSSDAVVHEAEGGRQQRRRVVVGADHVGEAEREQLSGASMVAAGGAAAHDVRRADDDRHAQLARPLAPRRSSTGNSLTRAPRSLQRIDLVRRVVVVGGDREAEALGTLRQMRR